MARRKQERKRKKRPPRKGGLRRRRPPKFTVPKGATIDYKDIAMLQKFVTDRGKILSRRMTGATAKEQRAISTAIKRAQFLGLLTTGAVKRI